MFPMIVSRLDFYTLALLINTKVTCKVNSSFQPRRLEEEQCADDSLVQMFFEEE